MSLTLAVAAGLGSALAYGAGTAGQHAAAYTGRADAGKLADLVRNPRWLLASAGDLLGIALQLIALANGPVVLVQPLLVLSLPVAVLVRSAFGVPRPSWVDLGNCAALILGLALFLALLGEPHRGKTIGLQAATVTSLLAIGLGGLAIAVMRNRPPVPRAVTFGIVAGCWFGVVSVLIEAVADVFAQFGVAGFSHPAGLVPLIAVVVLAVVGYLLVQIGFQLGPLGASFPPNLILDPVVAVVLGAVLLGERVPLGPVRILGYLLCVALTGWAAVRLADPRTAHPLPAEPLVR
ncbi:MAG: DMT family transporter [Actinomycetota bacterium]|nr:DMT family transporter [Actinomycetota bacterium]MDQ2956791.1 DMT family transporter [Actinomycetota bacterium]